METEKTLSKFLANLRGKGLLLLLAAAGILLLLFGTSFGEAEGTLTADALLSRAEEYRRDLEEELTALCAGVRGVGRVELVLTLEESERAVYATDRSESGEKYVTVGGACVLLSREYPRVMGVAVVCDGADDPSVTRELTSLLSAALGIGSNRIYISARA